MRQDKGVPTADLVRLAIEIVEHERQRILTALDRLNANPDAAASNFAKTLIQNKPALQIDLDAENRCKSKFLEQYSSDVQFVGEESLIKFSDWGPEQYCIIADMVDGTDLVEMNVGLWCSAIVIYDKKNRSIIGSVVGLSTGETYHAQADREGARVLIEGKEYTVDGTSEKTTLSEARVAFYGQKAQNFVSAAKKAAFLEELIRISEFDRGFRIYNFAGNPMMVKLCNRPKTLGGSTITEDIDIVFDIVGQQMHDVVPGAFIAMKGGAHLFSLDGNAIGFRELGAALYDPKSTLSYVLSSTIPLGQELCRLIKS